MRNITTLLLHCAVLSPTFTLTLLHCMPRTVNHIIIIEKGFTLFIFSLIESKKS